MYSVLASICKHHLRYSHTLPTSSTSFSAAFSDSSLPPSNSAVDPSSPFCASCTFYQNLTSQLAEAERHFATFRPHAWTKQFETSLEARNRLRALWWMDRESRRANDDPEEPTLAADGLPAFLSSQGQPEWDVEEYGEARDRVLQSGASAASPHVQDQDPQDALPSAPPPLPQQFPPSPPRDQKQDQPPQKRPRTTRLGLHATFLPTPAAPLFADLESNYRNRSTFWRGGSVYEPGKWTEPSGEGWLETSKMMTDMEEEAEKEKTRKAEEKARKAEESERKKAEKVGKQKEERDKEGKREAKVEEKRDVSPRRLRSQKQSQSGESQEMKAKENDGRYEEGMPRKLENRGGKKEAKEGI